VATVRLADDGGLFTIVLVSLAIGAQYRLAGNLLFLLGQGPRDEKGNVLSGKLGGEPALTKDYRRARLICLGLIAAMHDALGSPDEVILQW
jgi:hypothetical protein